MSFPVFLHIESLYQNTPMLHFSVPPELPSQSLLLLLRQLMPLIERQSFLHVLHPDEPVTVLSNDSIHLQL